LLSKTRFFQTGIVIEHVSLNIGIRNVSWVHHWQLKRNASTNWYVSFTLLKREWRLLVIRIIDWYP